MLESEICIMYGSQVVGAVILIQMSKDCARASLVWSDVLQVNVRTLLLLAV